MPCSYLLTFLKHLVFGNNYNVKGYPYENSGILYVMDLPRELYDVHRPLDEVWAVIKKIGERTWERGRKQFLSWICRTFLSRNIKKGVDRNPPPVFKIQYPMKILLKKMQTRYQIFLNLIEKILRI